MIAAVALPPMQAQAPAVVAPVAPPISAKPAAAPALKPLDVAIAVDLFKTLCWMPLRDPDAVLAAIPTATIPLAEVPRLRPGATRTWRANEALLSYTAADDLPPGVPTRQCSLRTRLAGPADQLTLAARVATGLGLRSGATRTAATGAQTVWDVRQADGRVVRLIVATANAPGGQTDLRQLALLLSPR